MNTNTSFLKTAISINLAELESFVNQQIPAVLYDNTATGGDNGVLIRAMKTGNISINADDDILMYRVPIKLRVQKNLGISTADAHCSLVLGLKSKFSFDAEWTLKTKTELMDYKWLEKPVVDLGFISFPVEKIVLNQLHEKRDLITSTLDKLVSDKLKLNQQLHYLLGLIPNPIRTNIADDIWWQANNVESFLGPISVEKGMLKCTIGLKTNPQIAIGKAIDISPLKVKGPAQVDKLAQLSNLNLVGGITIAAVEKIALAQLKNKDFSTGKYKINVVDADLHSDGTYLHAKVTLSGSFDGHANVKAIPAYDKESKEIYFSNVSLDLVGADIINKGIAMVAENTVKDKMKDALRFPIKTLQDLINKQLKKIEIQKGIFVKGYLSDFDLDHVQLTIDSLDLIIQLEGIVSLFVEEINLPNQEFA